MHFTINLRGIVTNGGEYKVFPITRNLMQSKVIFSFSSKFCFPDFNLKLDMLMDLVRVVVIEDFRCVFRTKVQLLKFLSFFMNLRKYPVLCPAHLKLAVLIGEHSCLAESV